MHKFSQTFPSFYTTCTGTIFQTGIHNVWHTYISTYMSVWCTNSLTPFPLSPLSMHASSFKHVFGVIERFIFAHHLCNIHKHTYLYFFIYSCSHVSSYIKTLKAQPFVSLMHQFSRTLPCLFITLHISSLLALIPSFEPPFMQPYACTYMYIYTNRLIHQHFLLYPHVHCSNNNTFTSYSRLHRLTG